jgi:hypothetical protein
LSSASSIFLVHINTACCCQLYHRRICTVLPTVNIAYKHLRYACDTSQTKYRGNLFV